MSAENLHPRIDSLIEIDPIDIPPIAVSLADRAIALAAIMEYLNKVSMTKGSKAQLEQGGGEFGRRYKDKAKNVQQGAEKNTAKLRDGFEQGIHILAATEAMVANGYNEDEVEQERMRMQMAINKQFGDSANADMRAAVVERVRRYPGSE